MGKRKRKWLVLLVALCASLACIAISFLPSPGPKFTREMHDRIRLGMTEGEVQAILGAPEDTAGRRDMGMVCTWSTKGSNTAIVVVFDDTGKVSESDFYEITLMDQLRIGLRALFLR
jgi:hypothetical protein